MYVGVLDQHRCVDAVGAGDDRGEEGGVILAEVPAVRLRPPADPTQRWQMGACAMGVERTAAPTQEYLVW